MFCPPKITKLTVGVLEPHALKKPVMSVDRFLLTRKLMYFQLAPVNWGFSLSGRYQHWKQAPPYLEMLPFDPGKSLGQTGAGAAPNPLQNCEFQISRPSSGGLKVRV